MIRCDDCGNDDAFIHETVIVERVYYDNGEPVDTKWLEEISSKPIHCGECTSQNIEVTA